MMDGMSRARVSGPLGPYAAEFRDELLGLGYSPCSAAAHLGLMRRLGAWLEAMDREPGALTVGRIEQFLSANRARRQRFPKSSRGAAPLIDFLRRHGIVPEAPVPVRTAGEELVERFRVYLVSERGLGAGTVGNYLHAARLFLRSVGSVELDDLARLEAAKVQAFILAESNRRSVASTKCLVSGLRSLLRFFHVAGITNASLVGAVPTVSGWSGTWLPRAVEASSLKRVLTSCDRRTAQGCRDYAVLVMLTRLAMRVGEVAAVELDDVDWRRGELVVRGKARRLERLPLPVDVGQALADYVQRARPNSEHRALFLRVLAPHRGLTTGGLIMIVQSACRRGGVAAIAAHQLRHTVAADLLRAGAGLQEIGQLLRHRSMASTAIYASVDTVALRGARPTLARSAAMSGLRRAAEEYLSIRRAVGFKLARTEGLLFSFVSFAESEGATGVSAQLALRWATLPAQASPGWWNSRLCVVRCFARHLSALDPSTEVPPLDLLPRVPATTRRATPYLYSPTEIVALMEAANSARFALTSATCRTIIGLLAVTGMRVNETLGLDNDDVDGERGVLIVGQSKFQRSREVPLHESTVDALRVYTSVRDQCFPRPRSQSFLVSRSGRRLSYSAMREHFERLVARAGLEPRSPRCRPRMQDFRHSFASATLEDWYRAGVDVQPRLPLLSTYLGHVDPASTYWYLSAKPQLLASAAERLERRLGALP